ncbi:unnamed protein product [Parnassius apollo]|uniref:(apollo) hypothetical protein n=1 Tax=Parnassius apollo TaxID=110799 RepID=A0A8S3WCZ4_PARAO|nr:unnamed protein product [Parnassius apollo]
MIAVTASCAQVEPRNQLQNQDLSEEKLGKQVTKRHASVIIKYIPVQPIFKHRPNVSYRRISNQKYRRPKPRYGITRTNYHSTKPSRKYLPKYGPPSYYKRPPKMRYGYKKTPSYKPVYAPSKRNPTYYVTPEPLGFGEPPTDYMLDYHFPKVTYGEPPVNSYRNPIKSATSDAYLTSHIFSDPIDLDNQDFEGQALKSWQSYHLNYLDLNYAASDKRPSFIRKPEYENPSDSDDDMNSYSDIFEYEKRREMNTHKKNKKLSKPIDTTKVMDRPWKTKKTNEKNLPEEQVVVGGRYAEPPARYVPKFHPNDPMASDDEDFAPPEGAVDPDVVSSATISPYVNYRNSNVAFSPQNLNDAFSIVD